ncbi:MAG TPA: LLM class flavin-dependent oxidoreductase [Flavipsychrobacter sp.]|nr:LLM class flavin-dependent oxidoreductase [Flavipsychrobacter sp.]
MQTSIPISVLDLAVIREGDNAAGAIATTVRMAQHAEQEGFKRFWLAEHHNMPSIASIATDLLIARVADKTQHIRVGSGGIMLPNHSPLSVAESFGTLDTLYPSRIDLGLGRAPGTDGATAMALRRNFASMHYDFKANIEELQHYMSTTNTSPVRAYIAEGADVPLWILGSSTDSAYLAAEMGLPYAFASHFAPAHLTAAIAIYKQHFQPSEVLQQPYMIACVNVIGGETDDEAQALATSLYQLFKGIFTNSRRPLQPPVKTISEVLNPEELAALQQMVYYTFMGSKETLSRSLSGFVAQSGIDELMVTSYIYDIDKRLRSLSIVKEALAI